MKDKTTMMAHPHLDHHLRRTNCFHSLQIHHVFHFHQKSLFIITNKHLTVLTATLSLIQDQHACLSGMNSRWTLSTVSPLYIHGLKTKKQIQQL